MNIFYSQKIQGSKSVLDETESHHCIKVLRLKGGDKVVLVDGRGGFFEGTISVPDHKSCIVNIEKSQYNFEKRNFTLHIAIAPTKNIDRFEWFLEKATEIGVDEITPIICQHSERKILREERLEKVITSAMKQSIKAYRPVLNPLTQFDKFVKRDYTGNKLIAHCIQGDKRELIKMRPLGSSFTLLIGPEGDFSETEVQISALKGFVGISLGQSRLRTETAGVAVCQIISDLMALQ